MTSQNTMSFQNKNKNFFVLPTSKIFDGNVSKKEASKNIIIDLLSIKNFRILKEGLFHHI